MKPKETVSSARPKRMDLSLNDFVRNDPLFGLIDTKRCFVKHVARDRDFGVIEAIVTVVYQDGPASVPVAVDYFSRTWVNTGGLRRGLSHRSKLVSGAICACLADLSRPAERIAA